MKRLISALALLLFVAGVSHAVMSVTWSTTSTRSEAGVASVVTATVTSADVGTASGTYPLHGWIVRVVTNPGATAPTDNYDCVLNDADGADVLGGALANRDDTNSESTYPKDPGGNYIFARVDGAMTLSCSAMGDTKDTVVRFLVIE